MSIASTDTYLNLTTPLSVVGSGGSGPGSVDAIVSGANISTLGASVGDVTVALQPALTNINSVAFATGGAITGLSTVNGVAVGSASALPANPSFSTITLNTASAVANVVPGLQNADPTLAYSITASSETSQLLLKSKGNDPSFAALVSGAAGGALSNSSYVSVGPTGVGILTSYLDMAGTSNVDINSSAISIFGSNSVNIRGPTQISSLTVSSIGGAAYPPAFPTNATLSTLALSTIGPIANATAGSVQTFNTVIGNLRLQGGVVSTTSAGAVVSWATAFTTTPIILLGCTGTTGAGTVATEQGGNETGTNISVNTGTTTEVYWLAIGAV